MSNHELSVEELLFPLFVCCDRCSSLPSLLEEEFWSEAVVFVFVFVFDVLAVLKEAFERRRKLRSFKNEGMAVLLSALCYWWRRFRGVGESESRSRNARNLRRIGQRAGRCRAIWVRMVLKQWLRACKTGGANGGESWQERQGMELEWRLLVRCWQCTGRSINGAFSV